MRKRFLIRIFLFLIAYVFLTVTTVAAKGEAESTSYFEETRAEADRMEEKYRIRILIGDECVDVIHPASFIIGDRAPVRTPLLSMMGNDFLSDELRKLEQALELYPAGFLGRLKDDQAPNGIRILLADRIVEKDPEQDSQGYTVCEGSYYNIVLAHTFFKPVHVHHEIWHVIERVITAGNPDAFSGWEALNPPGFQYSHDYTADTGEYDAEWFAREYGTVDSMEDRATIAEKVFREDAGEWFAEHPHILRKLEWMNQVMAEELHTEYDIGDIEGRDKR